MSNLFNGQGPQTDFETIKKVKDEIKKLWNQEEMYWGQRSRLKWLQYGDKNSQFFHATTVQRRDRNRIAKIKDADGNWVEGQEGVTNVVLDHYQGIYSASSTIGVETCLATIPRKITHEMNDDLCKKVTDEEITKAMRSLGKLKAPGGDGLNGIFYQNQWDVVGDCVIKAIKDFFLNGSLPTEISETQVVLIPKVLRPEDVGQYRPISCCDFVYKIISRILVVRLKKFMNDIISPYQNAFVGERQIQDNIVITHEALHTLKQNGKISKNSFIAKVDMSKAYDRLERGFVEECLKAFGFCHQWIRWTMACIKGVTYRFKINSIPSRPLVPQRGLRQGDPLSPYIFIIAMEALSSLLKKAKTEGRIQGISLARTAPRLSHLFFADDVIFFARASQGEAYELLHILNLFSKASGQCINVAKSGLIFGRWVPNQVRSQISQVLNIRCWNDPGKYLGLPAIWGRSKSATLSWIKEAVLKKMDGWKEKLLNQAGKEVLIKYVIQAIPAYAMTIFRFPKKFCEELCTKVARFWWAKPGKDRGVHWKKCKILSSTKKRRRHGF